MQKNKPLKKIAHFGAFNHDSFGDLIFPHIVEYFLDEFEICHVSPGKLPTKWIDQKQVISVDDAFKKTDWDGILVGGGDLIHSPKNFIWKENIYQKYGALSSLWCGASLFSAKLGIPCAWNSPGVPYDASLDKTTLTKSSLDCVDYISVRDNLSRENLKTMTNENIIVSPDSAILLSDVWPKRKSKDKYVTLSITNDDLLKKKDDIFKLFSTITNSKEFPDKIIILPLMAWRGFDESKELEDLQKKFDITVFDRASSLFECAMAIANSFVYIGNSLHGLITAVSYGVPASIVKPVGFEHVYKYEGFSSHFDNTKLIGKNFEEAFKIVNKRNIPDIEDLKKNVRENFKKMRVILKNKKNCAKKKKNWERVISENAPKNEKLVFYGLNIEKIFKRNDELIEDFKKNLDENLKEYENKVSELHSQNINMQKENLMLNEKLKKQKLEIIELHKKEIQELDNKIFNLTNSSKKTVEKLARLENELKVKDKELINYLKRIENDEISLINLKKEINDRNIQIAKLIKEIEQKDRHLEIIIDKEKFK